MRTVLASVAGGLLLFVWGAMSHVGVGLYDPVFHEFEDEGIVLEALEEQAPRSGLYFSPLAYEDRDEPVHALVNVAFPHPIWSACPISSKVLDSRTSLSSYARCFESAACKIRGGTLLRRTGKLIAQVLPQTDAPIDAGFRLRLYLFLYCHVTEMDDLHHLLGNLLRVVLGDRYTLAAFDSGMFGDTSQAKYTSAKAARVGKWSEQAGIPEIGEIFLAVLASEVRNLFFHSDYILFNN